MYLGQNTDAGQSRERDMQIMTDEVLFILLEKWSPGTRGQKKVTEKVPANELLVSSGSMGEVTYRFPFEGGSRGEC